MKKYLFGILAIALAVGFSAFTYKPFTSQIIYYKSGELYQRVEPNISSGTTAEYSINVDPNYVAGTYSATQFRDVTNWSTSSAAAGTFTTPDSDGSNYMWSFSIGNYQGVSGADTDGDDDNGISMEEALEAVHDYYRLNSFTLPTSLVVDTDGLPGNNITLSSFTVVDDVH